MLNNEFREDQYLFGFNLYATAYSYLSNYMYYKVTGNNASNCTTNSIFYNTTNFTFPYTVNLNKSNNSETFNLTNSYSQNYYNNLTSCITYFNGTNSTFTNTSTLYVTNGMINIKVMNNLISFILFSYLILI